MPVAGISVVDTPVSGISIVVVPGTSVMLVVTFSVITGNMVVVISSKILDFIVVGIDSSNMVTCFGLVMSIFSVVVVVMGSIISGGLCMVVAATVGGSRVACVDSGVMTGNMVVLSIATKGFSVLGSSSGI